MRFLTEYRDTEKLESLYGRISRLASGLPRLNLMEVCGTHTMTIGRAGLRRRLPENISLLSGPGCPVCVTPDSYLDAAIKLTERKNICLATFGDMMKVPGSQGNLEERQGSEIAVVYSPLEALEIARKTIKEVVFLAVGFETTAPSVASVVLTAAREKIKNFSLLVAHKLIPPAMACLLQDRKVKIDGFNCPGHVSAIIGARPYRVIAERYHRPCVIAGFEILDVLQALVMLLVQFQEKRAAVEIQYSRCVQPAGNLRARHLMAEVFKVGDAEWRGMGVIPKSGLFLKKEYSEFDAVRRFSLQLVKSEKFTGCRCGDILKGLIAPPDCPCFGQSCTPARPKGPCMVSSEGACAAYYRYELLPGRGKWQKS